MGDQLIKIFESIDEKLIFEWVKIGRQEDNHLDFKLFGNKGDCQEFLEENRSLLAKAISGFSNSEGGIIVWGIKAKKIKKIDIASEYVLIKDLSRIITRMNELTDATHSPGLLGIMHKPICIKSGPNKGKGFIKTYIPPVEGPPTMATYQEDNRYYRRYQSDFRRMSANEVIDMFGRRSKPKLTVFLSKGDVELLGVNGTKYLVGINLLNEGRGAATNLALKATCGLPWRLNENSPKYHNILFRNGQLPDSSSIKRMYLAKDSAVVLHPGMSVLVTEVELRIREEGDPLPILKLGFQIFADGIPFVKENSSVPFDEIRKIDEDFD